MLRNPKLKTLEQLSDVLDSLPDTGHTTVHCHGVFDLLHVGHISYLQRAKALGDTLIVTVTTDKFVNKGPHRPAFDERLRAAGIAALECVDYVALNDSPTSCEAIRLLKPGIYAKGAEFRDQKTPELAREEAAAAEVGTRVEFIEGTTSSSSFLINRYLSSFADDTEQYLQWFKEEYRHYDIDDLLRQARSLKVLVVGEAIIDEYYACETVGRSSIAPIVATRYESHQRYAGGAIAVANHLAGFCDAVSLVTMIGEQESEEAWLGSRLRENVSPTWIHKSGAPTIVKRRYRESYFGFPLFAINFLDDSPLNAEDSRSQCGILREMIEQFDLVVVADYGHAMLDQPSVKVLCEAARYLAVTTQSNAANGGMNTISKYARADFVSLSEQDLKLECRTPASDLHSMMINVANRLQANPVCVTLGSQGSVCHERQTGLHSTPSLATHVVDRIGAGDVFFAVASICAVLGAPAQVLSFLGNVAGAEAVATLGNSRYLDPTEFQRHIVSLLQ